MCPFVACVDTRRTHVSVQKIELEDGHRWRIRFYLGRDQDGRKQVLTETYDKKKDADDREAELKLQRRGGLLVRPSREPLATYVSRWISNVKVGRVSDRTIALYRQNVRRFLEEPRDGCPELGGLPLRQLRPEDLEELYGHLRREENLGPRTIQILHGILRAALRHAVRTGSLARNPAELVKPPRRPASGEPRDVMRAMTREEAGRFLEAAEGDRLYALWCVLLFGGLRPGEALGLLWKDVDLEAGRLHVRRALVRPRGGGWALKQPKTPGSRRVVVLPEIAAEALRAWRPSQKRERLTAGGEWEDGPAFVFTNEFGKPLRRGNLSRRRYRRILERAGLGTWEERARKGKRGPKPRPRFRPDFRLYDLRHTCATLLLLAGENPKVVSERLGHSTVALTLDTYSHVLPSMQERAAERLDALFEGAAAG